MDVVWSVFVKVMLSPVAVSGLVVEKMRVCCKNLREDAHGAGADPRRGEQFSNSQKAKSSNSNQRLQIVLDMD